MATALFHDGESGPQAPSGLRMHGTYAGPSRFSVEFYPESAVIGCGPEAARAYPYTAQTSGIRIDAPDHPIALTFRPDGTLAGNPGPYPSLQQSVGADFHYGNSCPPSSHYPRKPTRSPQYLRRHVAFGPRGNAASSGDGRKNREGATDERSPSTGGDAQGRVRSDF